MNDPGMVDKTNRFQDSIEHPTDMSCVQSGRISRPDLIGAKLVGITLEDKSLKAVFLKRFEDRGQIVLIGPSSAIDYTAAQGFLVHDPASDFRFPC